MDLNKYLQTEINKLQEDNLYRELPNVKEKGTCHGKCLSLYDSFSSNNYLGKSFGSGASRLISGNHKSYQKLEKTIATWGKSEAALVFPTGYMANLGTISTLMGKGDLIILDKLNHASIIDACYLSGADLRIYKHKDMPNLEKILSASGKKYQKILIVSEALFSMDGDIAPLKEIAALAKEHNAWTYIDEAHSTGIFGSKGAGLIDELNLNNKIDIKMGTLSKAIGGIGGYISGSKLLIDYLINKSRPFIYTTALPETVITSLTENVAKIMKSTKKREKLWQNVQDFYELALEKSLPINKPESPIIPIIIGSEAKTLKIAKELEKAGLFLPAIRFPTVPKGEARLRITINADQTTKDLKLAIDKLSMLL